MVSLQRQASAPNNRLAVLMSVRNGTSHLSSAIESILSQSVLDFHFIVVDDGSTDDSYRLCADYAIRDPRIRLYRRTPQGLTASLNFGLQQTEAEFIARMDADDVSHPARLASQIRYLNDHPKVAAAGTFVQVIDATGSAVSQWEMANTHDSMLWRLALGNVIAHPSVIFRRSAVLEIGGYDPSIKRAQDYDLWTRLVMGGWKLGNVPEVLLYYRKHPEQISTTQASDQDLQANIIRLRYAQWLMGCEVVPADLDNLRALFKRHPEMIDVSRWPATRELLERLSEKLLDRISADEYRSFLIESRRRLCFNARRVVTRSVPTAASMLQQAARFHFK